MFDASDGDTTVPISYERVPDTPEYLQHQLDTAKAHIAWLEELLCALYGQNWQDLSVWRAEELKKKIWENEE